MAKINFYNADIGFTPHQKKNIRLWLHAISKIEKKTIEEVNYIFCSDEYLHKMNLQFLQHDDYTDVITFESTKEKGELIGEIYISYPRIKENASSLNSLTTKELHRIMAHGLLHLLGYKDKTKVAKAQMTEKEDFYLNLRSEFKLL